MFRRNEAMPSISKEAEKRERVERIKDEALTLFDKAAREFVRQQPENIRKNQEWYIAAAEKLEFDGRVDSQPQFDAGNQIVGYDSHFNLGIKYKGRDRALSLYHEELATEVFDKLLKKYDPTLVGRVKKELSAAAIRDEIERVEYFVKTGTPIQVGEPARYIEGKREHDLRKASMEALLKRYEAKQ